MMQGGTVILIYKPCEDKQVICVDHINKFVYYVVITKYYICSNTFFILNVNGIIEIPLFDT